MVDNTGGPPKVSRKRRRPAVVCTECRRRKVACSRDTPCAQCVQFSATCTYPILDFPQDGRTRPGTTKNTDINTNGSPFQGLDSQNLPSIISHGGVAPVSIKDDNAPDHQTTEDIRSYDQQTIETTKSRTSLTKINGNGNAATKLPEFSPGHGQ